MADLAQFEGVLARDDVASFRDRVTMALDPEVDAAYPARWIGKVMVETTDGRRIEARMAEPFPSGRARINCTMPGPDGRWRWLGVQFYAR